VRAVAVVLTLCAFAGAAGARAGRDGNAKTVVVVTVGKPTELAFRLSSSAALPAGTVAFRVVNDGRRAHGFRLCAAPVAGSAANACAGRATRLIRPGGSATLTVTLSKPGRYEFVSTSPAEASAGMKGLVAVVSPTPAAARPAPATTTTAPGPASAFGPSGTPCASPQASTVDVTAFEFGFTISQSSVPCGTVTWVITDTGNLQHNFNVFGLFSSRGGFISPGETISATQNFLPGTYQYYCDFTGHIAFGMVGTIVVTP
jgi:plastocyanin